MTDEQLGASLLDSLAAELAEKLPRLARTTREEQFKIDCERVLRSALEQLQFVVPPLYEKRTVLNGLSDALYGYVVIEYEAPGTLGTPRGFAHAVDQLEGYIRGEALAFGDRAEEAMRRYLGVALDGRQIAFVEYAPNVVSPGAADTHLPTPQMSLFPISFAATTRFRATPPQEVSVESMRLLLLYLRALRRHSLTPENLSHYFGPGSDTARRIVGVFAARIHGQAAPIVAALFAEWRSAFGVVYGETLTRPDEHLRDLRRLYGIHGAADLHELLFAVHSYYALLTKTIAAELASLQSGALTASPAQEMALADSSRLLSDLSDLENGALFRKIGIRNFLEADYFGWYISTWDDELAQAVRRIPEGLAEFEPATSTLRVDETRDLLKRLYQYLMPESLRHDLGEYYTPDWLVEFLLDRAECYGDLNKTYLDPACGSGSFLVSLIRRMREEGINRKVDMRTVAEAAVRNITGFDINPLAVITARTNFLFALGDLRRYLPEFQVPVFLCDSLLKPAQEGGTEPDYWRVSLSVGTFDVPADLTAPESWETLAELLDDAVRRGLDAAWVIEHYSNQHSLSERGAAFIASTFVRLMDLHREGRDRIWARIIKNSLAPVAIGPRDFVVGNPPWIRWQYLSREYRSRTVHLWKKYGLFSLTGHAARLGGGEKDLSALFVYACSDAYLRDGGTLAFVITQTAFRAKGASEGFRRFQVGDGAYLKVTRVDDLVEVRPFEDAGNLTAALYIKKGAPTDYPVPYHVWRHKGREHVRTTDSPRAAVDKLERTEMVATPIDDHVGPWRVARPGSVFLKGTSTYQAKIGARVDPYGVYLVRLARGLDNGLVLIENLPELGKTMLPKVKAAIEPDLLFPAVLGRDIHAWFSQDRLISILMVQDLAKQRGLDEDWMKRELGKTYDYLEQFKPILLAAGSTPVRELRTEGPFYSMYAVGPAAAAPYKVAWRRMGNRLESCVLTDRFDSVLGRKLVIPIDTVSFIPVESRREADYLCALLNSTPIRELVASFSPGGRGFGAPSILEHLPISRYEADPQQDHLAEVSEQAHEKPAAFTPAHQDALDKLAAAYLTESGAVRT